MLGIYDVRYDTYKKSIRCETLTPNASARPSVRVQALSSGAIDRVKSFTSWMWGRWFESREMVRLSLGPFLAEVGTMVVAIYADALRLGAARFLITLRAI